MTLLKRLVHPRLTPELVDFLARHGLETWEDLLIADMDKLRVRCSIREAHLCDSADAFLLESCSESAIWNNGEQLLSASMQVPFSFGCTSLDDLLEGGVRPGSVLEVVGAEGSGKTQLCLQLAASAALKAKAAVLYLDTSASFSAHRIADLLASLAGSEGLLETRWSDCSTALKCIICSQCHDIFSALTLLEDVKLSQHQPELLRDFVSSVKILIVDSVSALATPVLGGSNPQGHALMIQLGRVLLHLAVHQNMVVLVTNHLVLVDGGYQRPALGESWKAIPHARILFEKSEASNLCRATLVKHSHLACGSHALFSLTKSGLVSTFR